MSPNLPIIFVLTESIVTQQVTLKNDNLDIAAYLAFPTGIGTRAAVIVIQEIFGVNDHIRDVTERFAKAGYLAIAPAIYQRLVPDFAVGYTPEAVKLGRVYKAQTKASELLSDIQATINYLYSLPQVKCDGVGCVGFCFGGHVAYLVATLPEIKATASFYGAAIPSWCPGEDDRTTLDYTQDIRGTLYGFFGTNDPSIPSSDVDRIETELTKYNIPHRIFCYPEAEHGFFCDRRSSYQANAAADAWNRVLDLFRQILS
jgi:carboxymethylenebutenolidase